LHTASFPLFKIILNKGPSKPYGKEIGPHKESKGHAKNFRDEVDNGKNPISLDAYAYILLAIMFLMTTKDMDSIQLGYPEYC